MSNRENIGTGSYRLTFLNILLKSTERRERCWVLSRKRFEQVSVEIGKERGPGGQREGKRETHTH